MGRKRNQGRARKAAKAKAREEVKENVGNNQTTTGQQQPLTPQMEQLQVCEHGLDLSSKADINCGKFLTAFSDAFRCKAEKDGASHLSSCLIAAEDATKDEFAEVWNDSAKMEIVISYFLCRGTEYILESNYDFACVFAVFARFIEERTAVELHQTQAVVNFAKLNEIYNPSDVHTIVKYFRKRIPCSCLDAKYDEVKSITKIGVCYSPECSIPLGKVERSKTMYCSRCRCITYCSPECQRAHWAQHKSICDAFAAVRAKFDAKQQNT